MFCEPLLIKQYIVFNRSHRKIDKITNQSLQLRMSSKWLVHLLNQVSNAGPCKIRFTRVVINTGQNYRRFPLGIEDSCFFYLLVELHSRNHNSSPFIWICLSPQTFYTEHLLIGYNMFVLHDFISEAICLVCNLIVLSCGGLTPILD